jgi:hypothetical protein
VALLVMVVLQWMLLLPWMMLLSVVCLTWMSLVLAAMTLVVVVGDSLRGALSVVFGCKGFSFPVVMVVSLVVRVDVGIPSSSKARLSTAQNCVHVNEYQQIWWLMHICGVREAPLSLGRLNMVQELVELLVR